MAAMNERFFCNLKNFVPSSNVVTVQYDVSARQTVTSMHVEKGNVILIFFTHSIVDLPR